VDLLAAGDRLAGTLPPLLVAADRVAATVWQGVHGRRRVGQGDAFWQFRTYHPGDAPQRIDWRQSAKSDQVYVRQSEWEAVQSVWLWRDASASMAYRSRRPLPTKGERADLITVALAALLARAGEHFALLTEGAGRGEPPATGRPALLRLAAALTAPAPAQAASGSVPPGAALPRYARVVLVGDWLAPLDESGAMIERLTATGVRGHLVQVLDPAEETLPFSGRVQFEGCEGEGRLLLGRVEALRDAYRARLLAHRERLQDIVRTFGWTLLVHHTDQSPAPALLALYAALAEPRGI
jgi:Uncharacterized conserved protein (some members contain a von Willebrand factor type A (vWA) domain)